MKLKYDEKTGELTAKSAKELDKTISAAISENQWEVADIAPGGIGKNGDDIDSFVLLKSATKNDVFLMRSGEDVETAEGALTSGAVVSIKQESLERDGLDFSDFIVDEKEAREALQSAAEYIKKELNLEYPDVESMNFEDLRRWQEAHYDSRLAERVEGVLQKKFMQEEGISSESPTGARGIHSFMMHSDPEQALAAFEKEAEALKLSDEAKKTITNFYNDVKSQGDADKSAKSTTIEFANSDLRKLSGVLQSYKYEQQQEERAERGENTPEFVKDINSLIEKTKVSPADGDQKKSIALTDNELFEMRAALRSYIAGTEKENDLFNEDTSVKEYQQLLDKISKSENKETDAVEALNERNTLLINLYAGPGAGKTTGALALAAELKKRGIDTEYVPEFAKELVLDGRTDLLQNQEFVTETQQSRLERLRGKVDVIVTDSPVLLGKVYGAGKISGEYSERISQYHKSFATFNLFMERGDTYQPHGRVETFEQAKERDTQIKNMLKEEGVFYGTYKHSSFDTIVENITKSLSRINPEALKAPDPVALPQVEDKKEWNTFVMPMDSKISENEKRTMFRMPEDRQHAGFIFSHPTKLVTNSRYISDLQSDTWENCYRLVYNEDFKFNLVKGSDKIILSAEEMRTAAQQKIEESIVPTAVENESLIKKYGLSEIPGEKIFSEEAGSGKPEPSGVPVYQNDKKYEKSCPYPLRSRVQFVCWRAEWNEEKGKFSKIPVNPKTGRNGKSNDPNTWSDFDTACQAVDKYGLSGIGIVLTKGVVGIDIDHCIDKSGSVSAEATDIMSKINSYTEISPSGDGLHILAFADLPEGARRNGNVEMYNDGRFFTLTGNIYKGNYIKMAKKEEAAVGVSAVHQKYVHREKAPSNSGAGAVKRSDLALDDNKLIEKMENSSKYGDQFKALYGGSTAKFGGDDSKADMALAGQIAFYTQDRTQIDRIFRNSGLMRDKWDERHGSKTYGEITIDNAIAGLNKTYDSEYAKKQAPKRTDYQKKKKPMTMD